MRVRWLQWSNSRDQLSKLFCSDVLTYISIDQGSNLELTPTNRAWLAHPELEWQHRRSRRHPHLWGSPSKFRLGFWPRSKWGENNRKRDLSSWIFCFLLLQLPQRSTGFVMIIRIAMSLTAYTNVLTALLNPIPTNSHDHMKICQRSKLIRLSGVHCPVVLFWWRQETQGTH